VDDLEAGTGCYINILSQQSHLLGQVGQCTGNVPVRMMGVSLRP
jgi:hypothetical protein